MTPERHHRIRQAFLDFFVERGHRLVASGPLVPAHDPTLMFTNAGMVPFKRVFTGEEHRDYRRATSCQKCVRISGKHNDLENVGHTPRHHTFFEMLGNFSFGDYFKKETIELAWALVHDVLRIDPERIVVTVFGGEDELAPDEEAARLWKKVAGLPPERIVHCGKADNFWQMGETGPCGPSSEIHYHLGEGPVDPRTFGEEQRSDGSGWFELWNLVFMQFDRQPDGTLRPLPAPSIDTGAGLERLCVVQQGVLSNYETDLLRPLLERTSELAERPYRGGDDPDSVSMRVVADHARMAAFTIAEGVFPDRDGRSYVLRRVMRRAVRHGHRLGIGEPFLHEVVDRVVDVMGDVYPELRERRDLLRDVTRQEEERFRRTLDRGLHLLASFEGWHERAGSRVLPGETAFQLYDTYGFPLDLQEVIGHEQGFLVDHEGFEAAMAEARKRSAGSKVGEQAVADVYREALERLSAPVEFSGYETERDHCEVLAILHEGRLVARLDAGQQGEVVTRRTPFYAEGGGQVGDRGALRTLTADFEVQDTQRPLDGLIVHRGLLRKGALEVGETVEMLVDGERRAATRRNHSATHLLHWALREVLGPQTMQKGSLVGPDRLRFDYAAARPMRPEEIERVEDLVNEVVLRNAPITTEVLPLEEAKARGAIGIFEENYGETVRMLRIGPSLELCGGTHALRTGDIGCFRIVSEAGLAAGVRRIEASTGWNSLRRARTLEARLHEAAARLKASPDQLLGRLDRLLEQHKTLQRTHERLQKRIAEGGGNRDLADEAREVDGLRVLGAVVELPDPKGLREMADRLRQRLAPAVVLLGARKDDGKALLVCAVSREATSRVQAGNIVRRAAERIGGGGGGRADFAQAGGPHGERLPEAVAAVYEWVAQGG